MSLKKMLTASFLLIAALPVIITGVIALETLSSRMEAEIFDKHSTIAKSMAGEIERFLDQPVGILSQIVEVCYRRRLIRQENIEAYLDAVRKSYPHFNGLQIVNNNGFVLYNTPYNPDYIGIDLSRQPFISHFLNKKDTADDLFWSSTFISPQSGFTTLTLSRRFPGGIIAGKLDLSYLKNVSDRIKTGKTGYAAIFDKDGTLIAHPDYSKVSQQMNYRDVYAVRKGLEGDYGACQYDYMGTKWIGSVVQVQQTGWIAGLFQPAEEAFASVRRIQNLIVLGVGMAVACAMAIAFIIVRKTMTPLSVLVKNTMRVKEGDYRQFDMPESYTEINELAYHFRLMTEAVEFREREIRASEENLRAETEFTDTAINSLNDTFFVYNPDSGTPVRWNKAFCFTSGYADHEISVMKAPENFYARESHAKLVELDKEIREKGRATVEIDLITKTGRKIPTEYSASVIRKKDGNVKYIISIGRDITERKHLQARLQYARKMEAIGAIAGGIAHEFNNILGIIIGNAELAVDDVPDRDPVRYNLDEIIKAGMRAKKSVHELLDFSRGSQGSKAVIELGPVIEESMELLKTWLPDSIDMEYANSNSLSPINADPDQIRQIIVNIGTNAIHAMEASGGLLKIALDNIDLKDDLLIDHLRVKSGRYAQISISDTGHGIDSDIMPRIFDPYFTTKEVGKGVGMGLSIVHGIVKRYKGAIHVQSSPGEGTEIKILFPSAPVTPPEKRTL